MPARTGLLSGALAVGLVFAGCSGAPEGSVGTDASTAAASTEQPAPVASAEPAAPAEVRTATTPADAPPPSDAVSTTTTTAGSTPPPGEVAIAFVGDVMLARTIGDRVLAGEDPFAGVSAQLGDADLVVGTLETTVGEGGVPQDKAFTFQAPPEAVDSLLGSGFDLVALANNHSYDYGTGGLTGTIRLLDEAGLDHVGAGVDAATARAPVVLSAGGIDTAFLSYVDVPDDWTGYRNRDWAATDTRPGVAWAVPEDIAADVTAAREEADHVVVLLHAGVEGSQQPSALQHSLADIALEAGATAVIGGHPHVLQGSRHEHGQLTAWSLGNFVFDGFGNDPVASRSVILTVTLDEEGLTEVTWTPVRIVDGFPVALDPDSPEGRAHLDRLEALPTQR